jgi:cytochrome P450
VGTVFSPYDPRHRGDPHPIYHRMRERVPVCREIEPETGRPVWFLTRYVDVQRALRHPALGRDFDRLPPDLAAGHRSARDQVRAELQLGAHLLNLDPPEHTRVRGLMTPAFGARTATVLESRIARTADELLDSIDDGETDLIEAFALPLPVTVIGELLGVPIGDRIQFRSWVEDMFRVGGEPARRSGTALIGYLRTTIAHRRAAPGDDLLSQLIQADLTEVELVSNAFLLLVAGHETTVNLIGNGTLELLRHPDQLDRLRDRPELMESAVEEMLRFNGPVEATPLRYASADLDLGGVAIPRGEAVLPVLLAANRDPASFPEPDRFDVARDPNRHLGFGHGSHYCLGAQLARLEARIALTALIQRFPRLSLATDRLEWLPSLNIRGVRRLPVRSGKE